MAAILWVPTWRAVSKHQRLISLSSSSMNQPQGCFFGDSPHYLKVATSLDQSPYATCVLSIPSDTKEMCTPMLCEILAQKKNSILGSNTCSTWASWVWSAHLPPTTPHHGAPTPQSRIPQDVFFQKIGIQNWDVQDFTGQDFVGLTSKNNRWFWLTNLKAKPG